MSNNIKSNIQAVQTPAPLNPPKRRRGRPPKHPKPLDAQDSRPLPDSELIHPANMTAQEAQACFSQVPPGNAPAKRPRGRPRRIQTSESRPHPQGSTSVAAAERSAGGQVVPSLTQTRVDLTDITLDENIQCRARVRAETVEEYAERMKAGDEFPPLVVFQVKGRYLLVDGFHRFHALQKRKESSVVVNVYQGTRRDAIQHAIRANCDHGLPRSNEDKRCAVTVALREFVDMSDHLIARECKVSAPFVGKMRRELETVTSSDDKRVGRDGKRRKLPQREAAAQTKDVCIDETATQSQLEQDAPKSSVEELETVTSSDHKTVGGDGKRRKLPQREAAAQTKDKCVEETATPSQLKQDAPKFCVHEAWGRIVQCFNTEYERCPAELRPELSQKLRDFADQDR